MKTAAAAAAAAAPERPVAIVFGASRGIGSCIAETLGAAGYAVVVSAKTEDHVSAAGPQGSPVAPPPHLQGSIQEVARRINAHGGTALPMQCDVRFPDQVASVVQQTLSRLGRVDALVYNPGAISWKHVSETPLSRYQLMHSVNTQGWYAAVQAVLPHMMARGSGRLLVVAPPIYSRFFKGKVPYAMTKVAASVLAMGLAEELAGSGVAVAALWPATGVRTAVTEHLRSDLAMLRTPNVFADACLSILQAEDPAAVNGRCLIDEDWLREACGLTDFSKYQVVPGREPPRMMPREFPSLRVAEEGGADGGGRRQPVFDDAKLRSKL